MKKNNQEITSNYNEGDREKKINYDKFKTTDVNILLNRVRLDKKKTIRKRLLASCLIASVISTLVTYYIIF